VCCSIYESNSDDETSKAAYTPAFNAVIEDAQNQSTPCEPSVGDTDSAVDATAASAAVAAVTDDSHADVHDLSEPEEVDGVGSSKFRYMNAADVAEALQTGGGSDVARVKSVHSDEEEADPEQSGKHLASADSEDNPPSSPPADTAVPPPKTVRNTTSDITPPAPETLPGSTSDAAQNDNKIVESENNSDNARHASGESPKSSPVPQSNDEAVTEDSREVDRAEQNQVAQLDVVADEKSTTEKNPGNKMPPRHVTMRRESRMIDNSAAETAAVAPVVELHIDADLKPTVFSDFELELLSSDAGSAVQKLKQFLENDESRSSSFRSSRNIPTAIQPGKAFDSLKYFLSTIE